jgi:hypothetical protein
VRGEANFLVGDVQHVVRPSFGALVAAEAEIGPLLALVDRAAEGRLTLAEMAALLWHCLVPGAERPTREAVGQALLDHGVSAALPALRMILRQVLSGST